MQHHDDGLLFHIWIILNGYHRTSTSSTTHTFEVCKSLGRDLYNLSVISGLRIGPNLITASALDSMLSSPKVKVKVKVLCHAQFAYLDLDPPTPAGALGDETFPPTPITGHSVNTNSI